MNANPLFCGGDAPVEGVQAVRDVLAYLEEQTTIVADFQAVSPRPVHLSPDGVSGQLALYGLLRRTLEQTIDGLENE